MTRHLNRAHREVVSTASCVVSSISETYPNQHMHRETIRGAGVVLHRRGSLVLVHVSLRASLRVGGEARITHERLRT